MPDSTASLEKRLDSTSDKMEKIEILSSLSNELYNSDPKRALVFSERAYKISEELNYERGKALSLIRIGECLNVLSDYEKAIGKFSDAFDISIRLKDKGLESDISHNLGIIYMNLGDYKNSLHYFIKSLNIRNQIGNKADIASTLNNIGIIYKIIGNYSEALNYYMESLRLKNEIGDERKVAGTLNNIGLIYNTIGDYNKALEYTLKSYKMIKKFDDKRSEAFILNNLGMNFKEMEKYDEALNYYMQSIKLSKEVGDKQSASDSTNNIAVVYSLLGNQNLAIKNYHECISINRETLNRKGEASALLNLGLSYLTLERYKDALESINEGLNIAESIRDKELILLCNKALSEIYEKSKDLIKSIKHYKVFHEKEREVFKEEVDIKTRELLLQYEVEKHQKESKTIKDQNEELSRLVNELNSINEKKNIYMEMVSHDLRDPISGIYSISDILLSDFENMDKEEIIDFINDIKYSSSKILKILKTLLDLNAIETGRSVLSFEKSDVSKIVDEVIKQYTSRALKKKIKINFTFSGNVMAYVDSNSLSQIISNLLSNAIKFTAPGKNIFIKLKDEDRNLILKIKDEGPGFSENDKANLFKKFSKMSASPTDGEESIGLGLFIVKRLSEMNNCNVWCDSIQGAGASFYIEIPKESV